MDDERDSYPIPYVDGFGSASTLAPHAEGKRKPKKRRPIGFAIPRKPKPGKG